MASVGTIPLDPDSRRPCYFFHGPETYLAEKFIRDLLSSAASPEDLNRNLERHSLEESSWRDIIDLARTVPFFFSSDRLIVVDVQEGTENRLSANDQGILRDYFASTPANHTVLVVIYPARLRKNTALFKLFSSLPPASVFIQELKSLNDRALLSWIENRFKGSGIGVREDAKRRLIEIVGRDLRQLDNEINKIITYLGDKSLLELDDVNRITGWVRTFVEWEISDCLEKADFRQTLIVLDNLLKKEGVSSLLILGIVAKFFREVYLAKMWLREKSKDRREIFRTLKPQISEKYRSLYDSKFSAFFGLVDSVSQEKLDRWIRTLEQVDLMTKTTPLSPQILLEGFLFDYCSHKRTGKV